MAIDELLAVQEKEAMANALGIHYEGVFANRKMCGALRPQYFKSFTGKEVSELPKLKQGAHMTTLAPEVTGGIELVGELVRQNWVVSIGHTRADVDTLNAVFAKGARHLTHFYNAMTGLHHRDVGVVGWAFSKEDVTFDIIADGIHVHPDMLRFACLSKGAEKVSLISDAVLPTGMGDGEFEIWGERVSVVNGRTQNERGSIAGSVITMLDAVKRMLSLGFSPPDVARMASLNPAKLLGIDKTHGSIEIGQRADLVALNKNGEVVMTMIGGVMVK
jgi:N-acetylglucosamine-6-phosphate deacetylase